MILIRNAWLALNLIVATVLLSIVVIVYSFFGRSDRVYDGVPRFWARWLLWAAAVRVHTDGVENLAPDRAQLVVANHSSWFDVLALTAWLPKRHRFVAKQELARVPLWGRAWRAAGHIAISRTDTHSAVQSLERAGRLVREDRSAIIIFPEGTRSASDELRSFKKGGFMLALHNRLEIVPTAIVGARRILPRDSWRVHPGTIILRFGAPVSTAEYDVSGRDDLIARVRSEIMRLRDDTATES